MLYCSWDMARDRCDYFSFWAIFCTFTPLTVRKINIKKKKIPGDLIILHKCIKNHEIICYTDPEIWCVTDVIVIFYFGLLFALLQPKKSKWKKNEKKCLEISSFYIPVPKIIIRWCMVPEIWCATDRQTSDKWQKGGCPT